MERWGEVASMSECGCETEPPRDHLQHRALVIALVLNAAMFVIGIVAGLLAHSSGLTADALDMLADAGGYGISLLAISRGIGFKRKAALFNGGVIGVLGMLVIVSSVARWNGGAMPYGWAMIGVACLSLAVNVTLLTVVMKPFKSGEIHLRAAWLCTRADVLANLGVIASGILVLALGSHLPDLVIGILVGLLVLREAGEVLRDLRSETDSGTS
jgi:Co/Zn/Cd efflux system component